MEETLKLVYDSSFMVVRPSVLSDWSAIGSLDEF